MLLTHQNAGNWGGRVGHGLQVRSWRLERTQCLSESESIIRKYILSTCENSNFEQTRVMNGNDDALLRRIHVDYRCDDVRFLVSERCVTISKPDSLISSSETDVNPGIKKKLKKKAFL